MNFGPAESAFSIFHASGRSEDVSEDGVGWRKPSSCAIAELAPAISKETATILGTRQFMSSSLGTFGCDELLASADRMYLPDWPLRHWADDVDRVAALRINPSPVDTLADSLS
jgi:hypothetical protein